MTNDPNDNLRAARLLAGILYADTGVDIEPAKLCTLHQQPLGPRRTASASCPRGG